MNVSRDMIDVALMSGRIDHVAESSADTPTTERQNMRADFSTSCQQAAHSVKVSFDTELCRNGTTLKLNHSHFMYLYTTQLYWFQRSGIDISPGQECLACI